VLCELEAGIICTADPAEYRRTLRALLKEVRIWPLDWSLVTSYGPVANMARERGRALSTTDLILAAFAQKENAVVLTSDKDFAAFPEIKTENWIDGS
jgi:predicted nucleic acid-binding protein